MELTQDKKINLHVCMRGQHQPLSEDNIIHTIQRIEKNKKNFMNITYNILYDTNNNKVKPTPNQHRELVNRIKSEGYKVEGFEYKSKFFELGIPYKYASPTASAILAEPVKEFIKQKNIKGDDYILSCRSDYYLTDEYIKRLTSKSLYEELLTKNHHPRFFKSKIWMPHLGRAYFMDMCDYHYLAMSCDILSFSIDNYNQATEMWNDSFFTKDHGMFVEKIEFIKPLVTFFKENKIYTTSKEYWNIIENNFTAGGYASNTASTIWFVYSKRNRPGQPSFMQCHIKHCPNISKEEKKKYERIVQKYGHISSNNIKWTPIVFATNGCDRI